MGQGTTTSYHENKTAFDETLKEVSNLDILSGTRYPTESRYENRILCRSGLLEVMYVSEGCRLDVAGIV